MRTASAPVEDYQTALDELARKQPRTGFAAVIMFVAPSPAIERIAQDVSARFPKADAVGCTTAGEISEMGYAEGQIVLIGLPASHFESRSLLIGNLSCPLTFDGEIEAAKVARKRTELQQSHPNWHTEAAFVAIDGLSLREDQLVAAIRPGLGTMPMFGGSAGDGLAFGRTRVICNGRIESDAAVVMLLKSRCHIEIFKIDHLEPTETKMVVTEADPENRIVREINAEPAAREYARLVGKDPNQLSPFIFASNPVVVKVGGQHHVRSIRNVEPNGDMIFYSAIDEGLVLTVARATDMADHLDRSLQSFTNGKTPDMFIGCDCLLRRLEAEQFQTKHRISQILRKHKVVGFNTYGEQFQSVHVNQTFTGAAIYPPDESLP